MNKPVIGLLFGAGLGLIDGATAWFTPDARPMIMSILIGSTVKGMLVGIMAGVFARKVRSTGAGIGFGAVAGLLLAWGVAAMGGQYYLEIMVPGMITGAIIGWLTQRLGPAAEMRREASARG